MHTFDGNCRACQEPEKIKWINVLEVVKQFNWNEIIGFALIIFFTTHIFQWWSIPILFFLLPFLDRLIIFGGCWIITESGVGPYKEKETHNTCSAGVADCKICDNEYSHEFNEKWEREHKWWDV